MCLLGFVNSTSASPVPVAAWGVVLLLTLLLQATIFQWLSAYQQQLRDVSRIYRLSTRDSLTGLTNRKLFEQTLAHEIERGVRYRSSLTILLIDIDGFHEINRSLGRAVGDFVLQHLADICTRTTREFDNVCRFSGGQIALTLPQTDAAQAELIATRLRVDVESAKPVFDHRTISFSVSIGGAHASCDEIIDTDMLINRAELALSSAISGACESRIEIKQGEILLKRNTLAKVS